MRRNKIEVYLHLVWGTWDRLPLIEPQWERRLHRLLTHEAQKLRCEVWAVNGMPDHVHLVVGYPSTVMIADLVKQLKGVSSRFINEQLRPDFLFKWQGYYAVFSVSPWALDHTVEYVRRQKAHHEAGDIVREWEEVEGGQQDRD
jgi:putative transposase